MTLKEIRKRKGYNLKDVANALHCATSTVCLWEKGSRKPKYEHIVKLAKLYGVSPVDVLAVVNGVNVDMLIKKIRTAAVK